jgi:hypothetical protein
MSDNNENKTESEKKRIFTGWNLLGTISLLAAIITGIGVPVWQNYWVDVSELNVEINGISRDVGPNIGIRLSSHTDLSILLNEAELREKNRRLYNSFDSFDDNGLDYKNLKTGARLVNKENLDGLLLYLKDRKENLPDQIKKLKDLITEINTFTLTDTFRFNELVFSSAASQAYSKFVKVDNPKESDLKKLKEVFTTKYEVDLQKVKEELRSLQLNLNAAETKAMELLNEVTKKESYFTVSAVLINSGKASISIKKPALLRVYVGTGTYIDINLELNDYSISAEVAANGTKIVALRSKRISKLPDEDQKLVDTYWGQSVHAILFIQDINGFIISSNRIPFSEGLYQKVIFDKLSEEASSPEYFRQAP